MHDRDSFPSNPEIACAEKLDDPRDEVVDAKDRLDVLEGAGAKVANCPEGLSAHVLVGLVEKREEAGQHGQIDHELALMIVVS